jgi:hypothetical protein
MKYFFEVTLPNAIYWVVGIFNKKYRNKYENKPKGNR